MGRPRKVVGLRTVRDSSAYEPESPALPDKKTGLYQFRSRASALRLSLKRRRIERGPEGEKEEVSPRSTDGFDAPLDWVAFEDNYFETPSPQLAELIMKVQGYGVGREVWSLEDEKAEQDAALERELRARVAERPDIADRVFRPSEAEDFKLPPA